jgi:hypothetical protein
MPGVVRGGSGKNRLPGWGLPPFATRMQLVDVVAVARVLILLESNLELARDLVPVLAAVRAIYSY